MTLPWIPFLYALVGGIIYLAADGKVSEMGKIVFAIGLLLLAVALAWIGLG